MCARSEIETNKKNNRQTIAITELPFQVNKARLLLQYWTISQG